MEYLTYEEYQEIGGMIDLTAFKRNINRACAMIDVRTQSRLQCFKEIPYAAKIVCADLVDYISTNIVDKTVTSKSQSAGGVSESESYLVKSVDDYVNDLDRILEPLSVIKTINGVSLTYRGAMS